VLGTFGNRENEYDQKFGIIFLCTGQKSVEAVMLSLFFCVSHTQLCQYAIGYSRTLFFAGKTLKP